MTAPATPATLAMPRTVARKNALQLDRAPTRDEAFEAQLSFGS